jgi:hypothetical protein
MAKSRKKPQPFDLRPFSVMECEVVNIGAAANGDMELLEKFKQSIRDDAAHGLCTIIFMNDEFAAVKPPERDLITINLKHPSVAAFASLVGAQ